MDQSFERMVTSNDRVDGNVRGRKHAPVDIEKNLIKYLFESHVSTIESHGQKGQRMVPGPVSVLLSQLGLSLPNPRTAARACEAPP